MKRNATESNQTARSNSRRYKYTKVLDNRKHAIRGLWRRNGKFVARITVEDDAGHKALKWVPVEAATAAEAQDVFRKLLVERGEDRLPHIGRCPKFADYVKDTYFAKLAASGKKPDTRVTEEVHLRQWNETIGHLYLDKIRPYHITGHLQKLKECGKSNRTCNLALVVARNVLKSAKIDGFIKTLPADGIPWMRTEKKSHHLYTPADIDRLCEAGFKPQTDANGKPLADKKGKPVSVTKNAQQFSDYIRLLALCGGREQETIKLRWIDVHFDTGHVCQQCKHSVTGKLAVPLPCPRCGSTAWNTTGRLTIGADADTKNHEARHVDFNPELEAHLRDMYSRRAPDSQWLFPSPQRGNRDIRAKTFRESLIRARKAAGMDAFAFHDCRHHFISYAVMAGIDFMTIARWVGHKDGGILIGKVYGHLSNEHAQRQAQKMVFNPVVVSLATSG